MRVARQASHEHPARVLGVILGDARGAPQINAQVGTGDGWTGETALIRLKGEVVKHAESVVLPLLLPDSPVAIWWPSRPTGGPGDRPARSARPAPDHRRRRRHPRQGPGHPRPVLGVLRRQHRPGLDPDHAVARAARGRPRPAPAEGHRRLGDRRADQPQRGAARRLAGRPAQGPRRPQELRRTRHHRGPPRHQGGPDRDLAARRPAGDVLLPRPARPAGGAEAPAAARAARRGAAPARRGRGVRRDRPQAAEAAPRHERRARPPRRGPRVAPPTWPPRWPARFLRLLTVRQAAGDVPAGRAHRRHDRRRDPPRDRPAGARQRGRLVAGWTSSGATSASSPPTPTTATPAGPRATSSTWSAVDPARVHEIPSTADADRRRGRCHGVRRHGPLRRHRRASTW